MMKKTKQTIERMVLTVAAAMVMVSLAAPAMAEEVVRDHRDVSSGKAQPIVRDHRDGNEEAGPVIRDHRDDSSNTVDEEEPYKDPGIRQCDLTPVPCVYTHGIGEPEGEADASAQAGQTADSGTVYDVCAYDDYYYDQETDMCWPNVMFLGVLFGDEPWPESVGGYVGLLGDFVEDPLTGLGLSIQLGLSHYIGDALIEFGDTGNIIGWPFQGLGYTIGFLGDAAGTVLGGLGEAIGGATDVVGEVVDGIEDAAEDAWDEVTSWF